MTTDRDTLQNLIDSAPFPGRVDLDARVYTIDRPVYLRGGVEVVGRGEATTIAALGWDAFVAMPPAQRSYDHTPHIYPNPLDPVHYSYRTLGVSGLRFHDSYIDQFAARQFTIETTLTRGPKGGAVAGAIWHTPFATGDLYVPAPWLVVDMQSDPSWTEYVDLRLTASSGVAYTLRYHVGPPGPRITLRFRVDLDAGTVVCEKDGVAVPASGTPPPPGSTLLINPGAPVWVGGASVQSSERTPYFGFADCTFHTFRVWSNAAPPPLGTYPAFDWSSGTAFVLPMDMPPRAGDPAVRYTGTMTGFGYAVPAINDWVHPVRVRDVTFNGYSYRGVGYGAGLAVSSAIDVDLSNLYFYGSKTGLRVTGGPLNNYPVRVRDVFGSRQTDCTVRLQRADAIVRGVTSKYPVRSVLRADICGSVRLSDVFHAPDGAPSTVEDVLRFDRVALTSLDNVSSDYEDGVGPRGSYLRLTGPPTDGHQLVRVRDFNAGSGLPVKAIDARGLPASARVTLDNSFGLPDGDWSHDS